MFYKYCKYDSSIQSKMHPSEVVPILVLNNNKFLKMHVFLAFIQIVSQQYDSMKTVNPISKKCWVCDNTKFLNQDAMDKHVNICNDYIPGCVMYQMSPLYFLLSLGFMVEIEM
jgi:hypothetical protein